MIQVTETLSISEDELSFTASRSAGPGGQNVNKVNTRVTLWFDVENSPSLSPQQQELIRRRLSRRVSRAGVLRIVCQKHRSQSANRKAAIENFIELLSAALQVRKRRKRTNMSAAARQDRRQEKAQRSELKRIRSKVTLNEE